MDYVVAKFCSACFFVAMNRSDEMNVCGCPQKIWS